ncbi:MAG: response regulator [Brevinematales bacterium]
MKILIVEDEALVALVLKTQLEQDGHKIIGPVATGEEAINLALSEKPDLIIMDIVLGGKINGREAAEIITKEYPVYIIFTSGYEYENHNGAKLSFATYLTKPIIPEKIKNIIETMITK